MEQADTYVLNTCTVTTTADGRARRLLRQARWRNPAIRTVAVGCYAERAGHELARIDGVSLVVGNGEKHDLSRLLGRTACGSGTASQAFPQTARRTRSFIRIQHGCATPCSYCVVPLVRPLEASVPADQVIREIHERFSAGCREVVLTGSKVGAYRHKVTDLPALLALILDETAMPRIRLSSLQPGEVSPALLDLWANRRLCPHFHLSLQSGSNAVLRRMGRRYDTGDFSEAVRLIRERTPDAAITTDAIVGFPEETDAQFEESLSFCRGMAFARIHVFPFSPRPGTGAARLPGRVNAGTMKERRGRMQALAAESARAYRQRFSGRRLQVLWEQRDADGLWSGLTGNYLRLRTRSDRDLTNRLTEVRLD